MEPLDKLKQMTAWDAYPALTEDELNDLLGAAAMEDSAGHSPIDVAWTPVYDLNTAAAAGWLIKAARAAATVEVDPPGSGIMTSKVFDNCRAMARIYRAKCCLAISIK